MKKILCFNSKGGVGKTTIAKELAMLWRRADQRVLCIDLDGQRNLSRHFLQDEIDNVESGVEVLFDRKVDIAKVKQSIYATCYSNIDILPATDALAQKGAEIAQVPGGQVFLKRALQSCDFDESYDICIIDVPPTLIGMFLFNALAACDFVLIPMELSQNSMDGLLDTMEILHEVQDILNPDLQILGILINKYSAATTVANTTIAQQLAEAGYNDLIFKSRIRQATVVVQAENARASVVEDVSGSNVASDLVLFFAELRSRIEENGK